MVGTEGGSLRLGRLLGIPIEVNVTWFLVFALVALSLATQVFPQWQPGLSPMAYWLMGAATALTFFSCLLAHEMAHSLMSRRFGQPVERITLFLFGGVSESHSEMKSPKAEFWIAIVGPLTSLLLGALFFGSALWAHSTGAPTALESALTWLAIGNVGVAVFNLLPGFPLDGGRVFRAAVWAWTKDLKKATRWASFGGKAFAAILMGVGLARLFSGAWFGGFWLLFLGWMIFQAAQGTYLQLVLTQALNRVAVSQLMVREPLTLDPDMTLRSAVDYYFIARPYSSYPVVVGDRVIGMLGRAQVKAIPKEQWDTLTVGEAMVPIEWLPVLTPDMGVGEALPLLLKDGRGRLPVVAHGRLVGLLSQTDVIRYLSWSQDEVEML